MKRLWILIIILALLTPMVAFADDPPPTSPWDVVDPGWMNPPPAPAPAPTPRPTPTPQHPNLRLVQPQSIALTPGEVQYVDIVVRNIGNANANNSLVTASVDGPFGIEFLNNANVLGNVPQNAERTVRARITTDANASAGFHSINLDFSFRTQREGIPENTSDTISVRIDAAARTPQLMLRNFFTPMQITPGTTFTINSELINLGEGNAYNVQAAIAEGLSSDGIFLAGSPNAPFMQTVEPDHSSPISFTFTASERITSGTFPIVFEVTGRDHAGEAISERFTYFVTVTTPHGGANRAFISLAITGAGGVIEVNGHANISMTVTNTGSFAARNIRIAATPSNMEAIVPASASVLTIGNLEPGESQNLSFTFSPTSDAGSHYHMVGFDVTYDTGIADETDSFEQFIGINVNNPDDRRNGGGSRPRLMVSAYSVNPQIVSAGEEFDLYMTFQNMSSTRSIYNIRVAIEAIEYEEGSGAVFTTVGASNTMFIESLAPRQAMDQHLRMFTVPNALPRTYNIGIIFDYEDSDYEEFSETAMLSVNVQQVARLEVANISILPFATVGQPVFVDFNIINSGRVTLGNLRVEMQGPFDTAAMDIFAGNMGRGNQAGFSGSFIPEIPGEQQGVLIVSGEDEVGNLIEVRHEFTVFVDEAMMWEDDMMWGDDRMMWEDGYFGGEEGESGGIWVWVVGIIVAVTACAVGFALYMKRKKNKQDPFADL